MQLSKIEITVDDGEKMGSCKNTNILNTIVDSYRIQHKCYINKMNMLKDSAII